MSGFHEQRGRMLLQIGLQIMSVEWKELQANKSSASRNESNHHGRIGKNPSCKYQGARPSTKKQCHLETILPTRSIGVQVPLRPLPSLPQRGLHLLHTIRVEVSVHPLPAWSLEVFYNSTLLLTGSLFNRLPWWWGNISRGDNPHAPGLIAVLRQNKKSHLFMVRFVVLDLVGAVELLIQHDEKQLPVHVHGGQCQRRCAFVPFGEHEGDFRRARHGEVH